MNSRELGKRFLAGKELSEIEIDFIKDRIVYLTLEGYDARKEFGIQVKRGTIPRPPDPVFERMVATYYWAHFKIDGVAPTRKKIGALFPGLSVRSIRRIVTERKREVFADAKSYGGGMKAWRALAKACDAIYAAAELQANSRQKPSCQSSR